MKEGYKDNMSRRSFLAGSAALLATGAEANTSSSVRPRSRDESKLTEPSEEMSVVDWEAISRDYIGFEDRVAEKITTFVNGMKTYKDFGGEITVGDPDKRTRLEYLATALELPNFHPLASEELKRLLPAKAMTESGLDASSKSDVGAKGILQFMPETWKEHACSENANILSLRDQVCATDSLLEQIRRTLNNSCMESFGVISEVFFAGDVEAFIKDFYVPVVINCFNAGAGTMRAVVNGFAEDMATSIEKQKKLGTQGVHVYGKDVYSLMAHAAPERAYHKLYKEQASDYVIKVFAAREALDTSLTESERLALLGELDVERSTSS